MAGRDIRFGLAALKGVGRGFTNAVLARRQADGPFTSFPDFCQRLLDEDLNKRVLESLIRAGAFDAMGVRRSQLLDAYEQLIDSLTGTAGKTWRDSLTSSPWGRKSRNPWSWSSGTCRSSPKRS